MTRQVLMTILAASLPSTALRADGLLFKYEGNVLPTDPGSGLQTDDPCEPDCSELLENGHFVLEWEPMGDIVQYGKVIAIDPEVPPDSLWMEWRFRSNQPVQPTSPFCDARMTILFRDVLDIVQMFQDAVFDADIIYSVLGLSPEFHTYRFESPDGANFTLAVDGFVFKVDTEDTGLVVSGFSFGGEGGCGPLDPEPVRNE